MIRKHKIFSRPKKAFELSRIKSENELVEKYGLKNKREIWKALAKVGYYRHRAMALAKASSEEQEVLFSKLQSLGLSVSSIADVLALTVNDLLNRRLQTVVFQKGYAKTAKQARQLVAHRRVLIDNRVMNVPSYILSVEEEKKLNVKTLPVQAKSEKKESNE